MQLIEEGISNSDSDSNINILKLLQSHFFQRRIFGNDTMSQGPSFPGIYKVGVTFSLASLKDCPTNKRILKTLLCEHYLAIIKGVFPSLSRIFGFVP